MGRISVFCSYAREDEAIRVELERHLEPLRAERIIDDWYDSRLRPGDSWNREIEEALDRSRLILFLVTPDLLASRYVTETEVAQALERERRGECQVVPIMAREAAWEGTPLSRFQALPGGGRWIGPAQGDADAYRQIVTGIREVCRRIVDWENPYKRASVGDWTHQEQTMLLRDGRSLTAEGTEELIGKTDSEATVLLEMRLEGEVQRRTMTVDLTRPLDDRMGDMMQQTGTQLPPNLEVWVGPAQYGDDVLTIGGRRYETIRASREIRLSQRGRSYPGLATHWRCIDVPLFGVVKGEAEMPDFRQTQVLLDFGFGDAAARKPRFDGPAPASPQPSPFATPFPPSPPSPNPGAAGSFASPFTPPYAPPPTPTAFGPGRWVGQVNAFGTVTRFDLLLHPNGTLQGVQSTLGVPSELHGQWAFDPTHRLLTLQVTTTMMGMPTSQDLVQLHISGSEGPVVQGVDAAGRVFMMQRAGG